MQKIKYISLIFACIIINISCSGYFLKKHYFKGYTFLKTYHNNKKSNHEQKSMLAVKEINDEVISVNAAHDLISNDKYLQIDLNNKNSNSNQLWNTRPNKQDINLHQNDASYNQLNSKIRIPEIHKNHDDDDANLKKSFLKKNLKINICLFFIAFLYYLVLYFTSMNFFSFILYVIIALITIIFFINFIYNLVRYFVKNKNNEIEKRFFLRFVIINLFLQLLLILFLNGLYFGFGFFGYLYLF